ncbi:MAG TPA: MaoC family dehydratase [Myxococcaceae bacterium]|nr:MaoC family dehydratase [Myxococcaceae bacterium]
MSAFQSRWMERVGQELGVSDWIEVSQEMIDGFAELTRDRQWIHIDRERAAREIGGTIAHGFLTVSLMSHMAEQIIDLEGVTRSVNYGFDKLRFITPVPAGSRVRMRETLVSAEPRGDGLALKRACVVEIEGQDRPAIAAEWISVLYSN